MDLPVETTGAKGKVDNDTNFPATTGSAKDLCILHPQGDETEDPAAMTIPKESVLAQVSTRDNTDGDTGKAVRNDWHNQMDRYVETTGAKGKVDEDSNFPATAGSSNDPFTLHPQGDGAEEPAAMTMPK